MRIWTIETEHVKATADNEMADLGGQQVVLKFEVEDLKKRCEMLESLVKEVPTLLREQVFYSDDDYVAAYCLLLRCKQIRDEEIKETI